MDLTPIDVGAVANNGRGTPLRTAMQRTNTNFATVKEVVEDHTSDQANPHGTTKAQVGLGSVDNTADVDKPISTKQAQALAQLLAGIPSTALLIGTDASIAAPYLSRIAYGMPPVLDMFRDAPRNGVQSDVPAINNILNGHNVCLVKPGIVFVPDQPIVVPSNGVFDAIGGRQVTRITRHPNYSGDTVQMGTPTGAGAAGARVSGFWFDHPGRFIGVVPDSYVLTNRLTADQAHIRAYGVQGASIVDCGGWGMPHFVVHEGGSGFDIVRLLTFGGMYNPLIPGQQESLSIFRSVYNAHHGYSVNGTIRDINVVGGNVAASTRNVTIDGKTYACANPRIGPRNAFLLNCYEVLKILGGFSGGLASKNFRIEGGGPALINGVPAWVLIRLEVANHSIDESMDGAIEFVRGDDALAIATGVYLRDNTFNGQAVAAHAITTSQNGKFAVARLFLTGGAIGGYQGSALQLFGVDGGLIAPDYIGGYNLAGFDTTKGDPLASGSAIYLGDVTRGVRVGPTAFGGGINGDFDPNSCQWGLADVTSGQGNTYTGLTAPRLGLAGGGASIGGTHFTP